MNNSTLKVILFFAGFALITNGCKNKPSQENTAAFSISKSMLKNCRFYKVKTEDVKNEMRFFGKLEADNNKTAQIFSPVGGVVKAINVGLGDLVKQGDVLATVQSSEIASFQKEKLDAMNNVAITEKNLQVAKDLFEGKLTSEKEVTAAEKELEKARAELTRINEVYGIYHIKNSSVFSVRAPISGFVINKNININESLLQADNEPLFSIANTNEIWAVGYVNESDISQIKENYDVFVNTLAFPDTTYHGKIEKIYNVIDVNTRSMKFRVRLANTDFKLKPNMSCTVSVRYSEKKKLIAVPSSAVIFDKSRYWVMLFKGLHNIKTKQIEIYRQLGDKTYIKSGLSENEMVISDNGILIYDALND